VKIVFLCTSLAPGRDGVGDYVRLLSGACRAAGHVCLLVALHDRHMPTSSLLGHEGNEIRLSSALSWSRRTKILTSLLREFGPDWVSWQMVPYGFHVKGILPAGIRGFVDAAKSWPNHVMLHELWLGLSKSDALRPRMMGAWQRRKLLAFLERLRPSSVHTTNEGYQLALARRGWLAEILPLFGNIPVVASSPATSAALLRELAGDALPETARYIGVIFGTIHPQWNPVPTLAWLTEVATQTGRTIVLLAVGRVGAHGNRVLARFAGSGGPLRFVGLGAQPPERISHLLHAADFGVATHPWALLEKSGTTVSLLEHGLPVLAPRDDWTPREGELASARDPLLRKMRDLSPAEFPAWLSLRRAPAEQLPSVAASFVAQLSGPPVRGALVA
jgi:hypothetical protein